MSEEFQDQAVVDDQLDSGGEDVIEDSGYASEGDDAEIGDIDINTIDDIEQLRELYAKQQGKISELTAPKQKSEFEMLQESEYFPKDMAQQQFQQQQSQQQQQVQQQPQQGNFFNTLFEKFDQADVMNAGEYRGVLEQFTQQLDGYLSSEMEKIRSQMMGLRMEIGKARFADFNEVYQKGLEKINKEIQYNQIAQRSGFDPLLVYDIGRLSPEVQRKQQTAANVKIGAKIQKQLNKPRTLSNVTGQGTKGAGAETSVQMEDYS